MTDDKQLFMAASHRWQRKQRFIDHLRGVTILPGTMIWI